MIAVLLGVTILSTFMGFYDKKGVSTGMSKLRYIFIKMATIIPFAALLIFIYGFELNITTESVLLLIALLIINATNYLGFIGVVKNTSPYETGALTTLAIPLIFFIDVLIGSVEFSFLSLGYLLIMLLGVFMLGTGHFSAKSFKGNLIMSILSTTAKGYLIHFFVAYVSIPVYILLVHIFTAVIILSFFKKKLEVKTIPKAHWKWGVTVQSVGSLSLALNAMLADASVSLYMLRTPLRLVTMTITSFFVKNEDLGKRPTFKKMVAVVLIVLGITLYGFNVL